MGLLGLLAGVACQEGSLASLSVRLLVTLDGSNDVCPARGSDLSVVDGLPGLARIRVTYRDPATGTPICDAVLDVQTAPSAVLGVPGGRDVADLQVEAFDAGNHLLASGAAAGVDLHAGGTTRVLLARSEAFTCAPAPLLYGRAFHSATPLPNGEVLIVGGVVADPDDPTAHDVAPDVAVGANTTGGLYATNSVEVYDPGNGTFAHYEIGEITARAFHEAYLLSTPGEGGGYQILLLGGLRVAGDPAAAPVADMVRDRTEPLPLAPAPDAVGAPAEILTYVPGERRLSWREVSGVAAPILRSLPVVSRAPSAGDPVAQLPPLVAGGWTTYPTTPNLSFEGIDPATGASLGSTAFFSAVAEQTRAAASLTWIRDDRTLLFGGNLGSPSGQEALQAAIVLSGVQGGGEQSAQMVVDITSEAPVPRAGHTATALGPAEILIAGGFQVRAGEAVDPAGPFAQRVTFSGLTQNPPAIFSAVSGSPELVGYHDAVALAEGVVVLTGGRGTGGASRQALRYDGALSPLPAEMVVPRYGHRLTLLADGSILVSGGLDVDLGTETRTVGDVELYNPRTAASDPRPPGEAAGPSCPVVE